MFTSGVTLIPTLSCQDKENAVYTTESHDNGIATLTEARCLEESEPLSRFSAGTELRKAGVWVQWRLAG